MDSTSADNKAGQVEHLESATVVTLDGPLKDRNRDDVYQVLSRAARSAGDTLIVDFASADDIEPMILGAVLAVYVFTRPRALKIVVVGGENVRARFSSAGLDSIIPVYTSREQAC